MNNEQLSPKNPKKFSLSFIANAFMVSIERFPITSVMIFVTTIWLLYYIEAERVPKDIEIPMNFTLPMSCLLSLAVSIWCRVFSSGWKSEIIAQIVTGIILVCDFIYLLFYGSELSVTGWTGHLAAATAGFVAILFIPTKRNAPDRSSWMFTNLQLTNIFVTVIIAVCLFIAVMIIGFTIDTLLVSLSYKTFAVTVVLLSFTLCSFIFLSRIPSESECATRCESYEPTRFRIGVTKFLLLPITLIYLVILYVYGIKILFLWELPDGIICWSVSGLSLLVMFVLFQLEALYKKGSDGYTSVSSRLLPWLMIPLLIMMSVAIGYRINQYGITPSRLYVAAFNLWTYAAFAYLAIKKGSWKLNKVAMSFAVVFLLTSIIPGANMTSVSNRYMRNSVKRQLTEAGLKQFPANREEFTKAFVALDQKSRSDVYEKLKYLDSSSDHQLINDIISFPVYGTDYYIDPLFDKYLTKSSNPEITYYYRFLDSDSYRAIPEGYSEFKTIDIPYTDCKIENGSVKFADEGDTLTLNINQLENLKGLSRVSIRMPGDSLTLCPEYIRIQVKKEGAKEEVTYCYITGLLFKK